MQIEEGGRGRRRRVLRTGCAFRCLPAVSVEVQVAVVAVPIIACQRCELHPCCWANGCIGVRHGLRVPLSAMQLRVPSGARLDGGGFHTLGHP